MSESDTPPIRPPPFLRARFVGDAQWLVTTALEGRPAVEHQGDATAVVVALAEGLRRFHDAVPVAGCPFDFRLDTAMAHVQRRVAAGLVEPGDLDDHRHLDVATAHELLVRTRPDSEDLVVCHGDYCPPNVLLVENCAVGYVDLGELGVADRWLDLAVATRSTTWNFGPSLEDVFLAAYGAQPDPDRQTFYRLLYDLAS